MEYEDWNSAFCTYYVTMTDDLLDKIKFIHDSFVTEN